ncbi:MAG TPA: complex I NDUFA9 subunit family protein [Stellaceae bacterium]|nr:complex I NDUFA9 subunit family protein [Stellaceae bacterium]
MAATARRVTVFGGSGFIGRYLVKRLAAEGWVVRVAVRDPVAAAFLKPAGNVGQIVPMRCNVRDEDTVAAAATGADVVINLVGILYEFGRQRFDAVQAEAPAHIGRAAAAAKVARYIHVSAIGAHPESPARYARTKAAGEAGARAAFPGVTIVRPSIVIGPEDGFFNRFARMAQLLPFLPLIGGGHTRFQPAYVGDVADGLIAAIKDASTAGRIYELGGPRIYTFRELMELMLRVVNRRRWLVSVPFGLAEMKAAVLQLLPVPPLTRDQVKLLEAGDNVVAPGALTFADLGLQPQAIEAILPTYLDIYRSGGRFAASRVA